MIAGDLAIVDLLRERGANVNRLGNDGVTLLHMAASRGHRDVVEVLLRCDAVSVQNKCGDTPLALAARNGHRDVVEVLLRCGAVSVQNKCGDTPLALAARNGHRDVVEVLLNRGEKCDTKNMYDRTPLHDAANRGHLDVVKLLLNHSTDVDVQDKSGATPLHKAASRGHRNVVEVLLNRGAAINAKSHDGRTALYLTASKGHRDVVKVLLKHGVNVKVQDKYGVTSLQVAALRGETGIAALKGEMEILNLLVAKGARFDIKNITEETPLLYAIEASNYNSALKLKFKKYLKIYLREYPEGIVQEIATYLSIYDWRKFLAIPLAIPNETNKDGFYYLNKKLKELPEASDSLNEQDQATRLLIKAILGSRP